MALKTLPRKHHLCILFVVAAMTVPFLDKAVHIDDTPYIYTARQILQDPLRPFDFAIDWQGTTTRAIRSINHPPLLSYYLSLPLALLGESEPVLHGSMILFTLMAAYSMYFLTGCFAHRPLEATLLFLAAPPFFVAASTLMLDIPVLACVLAATALFVNGLDSGRRGALAASGVLLGSALLMKEGAALQFALLGFYAYQRGKFRDALMPLGLGGFLAAAWVVFNFTMSGELPTALTGAWSFTVAIPLAHRVVSLISYLGGSLLVAGCFTLQEKPKTRAALALLAACALFLIYSGRELPPVSNVLLFLLLLNGACLLIRAGSAIGNRETLQDPDTQFLLLWLALSLILILTAVPFNAMRHMLMFLAPLILLLFRTGFPGPKFKPAVACNLALLCFLSLGISIGDYHYSDTYRKHAAILAHDVRSLHARSGSPAQPVMWYLGHWGFQYYMDGQGGKILGFDKLREVRPGDWVLDMEQGHKNFLPSQIRSRLRLVSTYEATHPWPFRTMNRALGAGWYAEMWGPLPFALNPGGGLETFSIYQVAITGNPE